MNYLMTRTRPYVLFDVEDPEHRKLFAQYILTGRWNHCPYQFVADEPTQIDVGTIQRQLIAYYTRKEFGKKLSKSG